MYNDAVDFRRCLNHHDTDEKCSHAKEKRTVLRGKDWNTDRLDIEVQCIELGKLQPDVKSDDAKLLNSPLWITAVGIMPKNPLALVIPVASHWHLLRMRLKAGVNPSLLGLQDLTFMGKLKLTEEVQPATVLPDWVSHMVMVTDNGREMTLSDRYCVPLDTVWEDLLKDQQIESGLLLETLETNCVRIFII